MRIRRVGDAALLVDLTDDGPASTVDAWRADLWRRRAAGEFVAVDIVPGACTVLLDGVEDAGVVAARLRGWPPPVASASAPGPLVEIPIRYDGPDLTAVAAHWQVSVESAIARHADTEFRVAFCGFAPGFAYMTGLSPAFAVPQLDTPRTRVPPGSVALADIYCGIYPRSSPGGWLLIGRTDAVLFDAEREPPVLLGPGTLVRFLPVSL